MNSYAQTRCDFGPFNEVASRFCQERNIWGLPQVTDCGTQITRLFMEFNESMVSQKGNVFIAVPLVFFSCDPLCRSTSLLIMWKW